MNWTLEVIVVPITDLDRARAFYADGLGFHVDHDTVRGGQRLIQFTPRGSGCSVVIGSALRPMPPGTLRGMQLVVNDLRAAHAELLARGVPVSDIQVRGGPTPRPATPDDDLNFVGFLSFQDPDGNGWSVQQITARP
ncbi:glyoxalase [Deinococcus arenae]|uniref:Glyoxalase n=1 Tax=Deinococcus arenae TaxID=1452751 RepID=A0A8H9GS63_9DEIO|nr:VOC family protein [Deinococcus arenae]AWT36741.1 glyoxalase [Deinococcus actinosclerus]GGM55328.1 glyoxalase [Deinococcus arenae]